MDLSDASEKIRSYTTFRLVAQRLNHYAARIWENNIKMVRKEIDWEGVD